jgi:nucleotide-binding universal stress UspA family protein
MAGTLAGPQLPYQWSRILSEIEAAGVVPPASVIDFFVEEHSRCLSGFKNAQEALQRALATQKKFAESSSTGLVPSAVIKSVKMPYVQVMKLAVGIETDLVVTAAKALAEKELSSAAVSCTKYLSALYEVQVCAIRDKTKVANVADEFAVALTAIGASIMSDATGGDGAVWAPLIARLKMAFTTELETAMVEFVAIFRREAQAKEAKANAVNTARADAEMADGTRPVAEIIDEKIGAQYESTCPPRSHPSLLYADTSPFPFLAPRAREEDFEDASAGVLVDRDVRSLQNPPRQTEPPRVLCDRKGEGEEGEEGDGDLGVGHESPHDEEDG